MYTVQFLRKHAKENEIKLPRDADREDMILILKEAGQLPSEEEMLKANANHINETQDPLYTEKPQVNSKFNSIVHGDVGELNRAFQDLSQSFVHVESITDLATRTRAENDFKFRLGKLKGSIKQELDAGNMEASLILKTVLQWERSRKIINLSDEYHLNEIEMGECTEECEQFSVIPAPFGTQIAGRYPYRQYFDEGKQTNVYVIFVPRVIAPEEQISKALDWKIKQGYMPAQEDYAPEKTVVHRRPLRQSEFNQYFRHVLK